MGPLAALLTQLFDRLIQLASLRKAQRRELLTDHVEPVFGAFQEVHEQYIQSFARYRNVLKSENERFGPSHPLLDMIRTDNLFTEHERTRTLEIGQAVLDPQVSGLMTAIRDYLVDTRIAQEPLAGYRGPTFSNPQLWRRTLLGEIEAIFDDRWAIVLDPCASAPPLYDEDLEIALAERRRAAGISDKDPHRMHRLKAHLAVEALDEVVRDMQDAYSRVSAEYAAVRITLTK